MDPLGWLERWALQRSFRRLVKPGIMELIEKNPKKYFGDPEKKHIQFLLVQVDDRDTAARIADMPKVVDTIFEHNGTLGTVLNVAFVFAFFGSPFPGTDTDENRLGAVAGLQAALGNHIRIAHGHCVGLVGNFGAEKRLVWDALIPNFSSVLSKLLSIPFGTAIEIHFSEDGKPETGNQ